MILPYLRTFSIAREAGARQILTFGTISWRMSFTICLDTDVCWVAGRSRLLPAFTAASRLPQCSPSTMPISNRWLFRNVRTLLATLTRVSVRMGPEWVLRHAGLIRVLLRYRPPVSLAMPDEISCGGRRLRNLTHRCTKILRSLNDGRSRLEWRLITCSTIRILGFRVTHKVRFPLGGNGDAVFKDAAGHFAANAGQILTTAGTGRQIQLAGRFTF